MKMTAKKLKQWFATYLPYSWQYEESHFHIESDLQYFHPKCFAGCKNPSNLSKLFAPHSTTYSCVQWSNLGPVEYQIIIYAW